MDVQASAQKLWEMVSDITNMPRWSPETYRTRWVRGSSDAKPGAWFKGTNRWGWIRWRTTCEVEVAEPGREFTFVTYVAGRRRTRWSYTFAPKEGSTTITESRTILSRWVVYTLAESVFMRGHQEAFAGGMRETLHRIKTAAEGIATLPTGQR